MRAHQISPESAKSVEPRLHLIAVPIRCRCVAPIRQDRCQRFSDAQAVEVNGLRIEDATIKVTAYYIEDGGHVDVEFSGTIAVFAQNLLDAIEQARQPQIEFIDGWVKGIAQHLRIDIVGEIVMAPGAAGGRVFTMVGADR